MYPTQQTDQSPETSRRQFTEAQADSRRTDPVETARLAVLHAVTPNMAEPTKAQAEQTANREPLSGGVRFGVRALDGLLNTIYAALAPTTDIPVVSESSRQSSRRDFTLAA